MLILISECVIHLGAILQGVPKLLLRILSLNMILSKLMTDMLHLHWRHNGCDGVSNHHPHDYLLNRLFRRRSKKTSKLRLTGPCAGNSPETGEFPAQMASNVENVSIWWRHHWSICKLTSSLQIRGYWQSYAMVINSSTLVMPLIKRRCRLNGNCSVRIWHLYIRINWQIIAIYIPFIPAEMKRKNVVCNALLHVIHIRTS